MLRFNNQNVNPKNRKTGDCATRALASLLGIAWDDALKLQCQEALKSKYDPTSHQVIGKIVEQWGWVKMKQPRKANGRKYTVKEMDAVEDAKHRDRRILCNVANHYVVIEGDRYIDTWDSGGKTVGNYYVKPNK